MTTTPVTPDEVKHLAIVAFPEEVIQVFNYLIVMHYVDGKSKVLQREAIQEMVKLGIDRGDIFKKGYLNIEAMYESAGWKVTYDRPGYDETYDTFFLFEKL